MRKQTSMVGEQNEDIHALAPAGSAERRNFGSVRQRIGGASRKMRSTMNSSRQTPPTGIGK
jgi:hypothetical protein